MSDSLGYRIQPHVVTSSFDEGEGVLIDLESRRYYQLNETAMFIVNALTEKQSMGDLVARLINQYDVAETTVKASIDRTLRELLKLGFIEPCP